MRSSVSGVDCEGWSDGAESVCSQAEESAFRAVQGVLLTFGGPVARGGGLESRRRVCLDLDRRWSCGVGFLSFPGRLGQAGSVVLAI